MAKSAIPAIKLISIALIVIGAGLFIRGFQLSDSTGSQLTETISGSMPDEVMLRYIAGAASLAMGVYLLFKR